LTASRQISGALHALASFSVRQYDSADFNTFHRLIYSARIGFGFSPGDVPLRIW
jgi:hypothetical protein